LRVRDRCAYLARPDKLGFQQYRNKRALMGRFGILAVRGPCLDDSLKGLFGDEDLICRDHLQPGLRKLQPRHPVDIVRGGESHLQAIIGVAMIFVVFAAHDKPSLDRR
jgi:hypothetical protein